MFGASPNSQVVAVYRRGYIEATTDFVTYEAANASEQDKPRIQKLVADLMSQLISEGVEVRPPSVSYDSTETHTPS